MSEAQTKLVLKHLKKRPIDPLTALRLYGCMRLAARIQDLEDVGHVIQSSRKRVRNADGKMVYVALYSM